jgi:hypothetical protein
MRLFHCSNEKHDTLTPQVGGRRHGGEGAGAVDKAVIWLSNDGASVASDSGQIIRFRHEVEVPDGNPDLVIEQMMQNGRTGVRQADAVAVVHLQQIAGGESAWRCTTKRPKGTYGVAG